MLDEHGFITEQRYSQWQKKKVKTIVVNCRAKNPTLRSIANAINIAKPYDRIELTEGEYQESFTVNFPLEIVSADGEEAQIITRNSGITVTAAVELYIENLTIISKSSSKLDAAVVFMAGNPVMFRCKISSLIMGGTSRSHVENCVITESSAGVGVVVQDNAGGTIQSTTVHSHSRACLEIDTRGELKVVECQLYNYRNWEGDVVVVSGAISSVARDTTVGTHLACSKVEIAQCQIYLSNQDDNRRRSSAHQAYGSSPAGSYCVNINSGAAPTFSQNELIEGEIGFLLDGAGPAQLKGNVVRCQRKSGILAYIEDEHVYAIDKTNFCIKGDNIFDRCHIGIDVQASSNRTQSFDSLLSNDTPSTKHVFRWSNVNSLKPLSTPVTTTLERDFSLVHHGELTRLSAIKQNLNTLATCVLEAYPTCLQHSFNTNSVGVGGSVRPSNQNVFAELLNTSLQTTLDQADSREEAVRNMDHFRGNRGIDIINTKFSNCSICAIRFGRQGYGRVEDCVFEDSGTHAIVVDCGAHPIITGCRFLRSRKASIVIANFANPLIIGNEISGGLVMAMVITRLGRGVVLGNIISGNHGCGIVVENSSQPLICANLISSNRTGGAVVENFCDPLIVFNQFSANISSQIVCSQSSDAFIAYNSIQSSPDYGVKIVLPQSVLSCHEYHHGSTAMG
ncbi:hypothetical protein AGDE_08981 [Angomonas deanei]|uniref:Right handed beta helix domain-containing protein n=1 Tax=Angomonas deanei TaxID=59799 RepID=A0A7G2CBV2_9TRYP|nr:hypothetical protein AGDE_08981 [Angomonas deanei]CAD2215542.1 Protein of unknown function (DUF1565)/Periplasmic copper-binding protein (NosD)/Right handed beta helix region containing protein, putative [Angomonas deanei]|eukprot:EPY31579.1 hypothetical protein AGDE_08981 [Angomonas deanei]